MNKPFFHKLRPNRPLTVGVPEGIVAMEPIPRAIYTHIYKKRFDDLNYFTTAIGKPGSGKTSALLRMAEVLQVDKQGHPNFDVEKQVVFTCEDFTKSVQQTNQFKEPGKVILFDEIEVEANSKSWDVIGQTFALTTSTCRFKLNILMASLPLEQQLILHGRELRDSRITCSYIDKELGYIVAKFENLEYNVQSKDTYGSKYYSNSLAKGTFFRINSDDLEYTVDPFLFKRPSAEIERKYKKMKYEYLAGFYEQQLKQLAEKSKKKQVTTAEDVWEFIDKNKKDLKNEKGIVDPVLVHTYLGIPLSRAKEYTRTYDIGKLRKELKRMPQ